MNPGQLLLVILLVLAHLSVDAVVIAERSAARMTSLFNFPPPISQIGLLALWVGFGKSPFWIRLPLLLAWATLWSLFLENGGGIFGRQLFLLLSIEAVLILGVLLVFRLCGVGVSRIDPGTGQIAIPEDIRLRFPLRDLFVVVTVTCVCLGEMPWLVENWHRLGLRDGYEPMPIAYSEMWAVLTLLAVWLALGVRYAISRFVVCLLLVAAIASITLFDLEPKSQYYGVGWITAECLLLTYSSLLVLRLNGYRLVNQRAPSSQSLE